MGGKEEEEEEEALAGNIHQEVTYPVHVCMGRERERGGWEGSPVFPPQDEEDTITAIRKGRRWEEKTSRTTPPPAPDFSCEALLNILFLFPEVQGGPSGLAPKYHRKHVLRHFENVQTKGCSKIRTI